MHRCYDINDNNKSVYGAVIARVHLVHEQGRLSLSTDGDEFAMVNFLGE